MMSTFANFEQSNGTGSSVVFPVYDAHGNNVASLSRDGMGYQVSNRRSFDAWGNVRLGAQTGDPTGRYCGNLGHKQDDESGLVYMRARYYEPGSGRFVSEDPAMDGGNWYVYVYNRPGCSSDPTGKFPVVASGLVGLGFLLVAAGMYGTGYGKGTYDRINDVTRITYAKINILAAAALLCFMGAAWSAAGEAPPLNTRTIDAIGLILTAAFLTASLIVENGKAGSRTLAGTAVVVAGAYGVLLLAEMTNQAIWEAGQ